MRLGLVVVFVLAAFLGLGVGPVRAESGGSIQVLDLDVSETIGNMDGSLDSGETGLVKITLMNALGYEARATSGTITTNQPDVSVTDGYAWWGSIENGSTSNPLPDYMGVQLLPGNSEAVLLLTLVVSWMDSQSNWFNATIDLSVPINQGYDVVIDTGGWQHDVTQPIIIKAEPVGKLDRQPVLGAQVTMTITQPDRTRVGPILLGDDGQGVDEQAGDGVYMARFDVISPFPVGVYEVRVEASKDGLRGKSSASIKLSDPFLVWNDTYGGTVHDEAMRVVPTGDGGFVIAGSTSSSGANHDEVYLVRVDSEGTKVWQKTYGTAENDYARAVVQSGDGGFVVAGFANCPLTAGTTESCDAYLLKVDADGEKV